VICGITSRRGLLPSAATPTEAFRAQVAQFEALAGAGVDLIQIREPDLDAGDLAALAEAALRAVEGTATKILLNDRLDVALAAGAHGVHLRASAPPAARLRTLMPAGFLAGRSVHPSAEAEAAEQGGGLDYLILGTIFPSASKRPGHPAIGTRALAAAVQRTRLPILAVGGITMDRAREVAGAGAAGVAAISLFQTKELSGEDRAKRMAEIVRGLRIAFDTTRLDPYH
jgi:thiamine-phosphate pyrophosphorylase